MIMLCQAANVTKILHICVCVCVEVMKASLWQRGWLVENAARPLTDDSFVKHMFVQLCLERCTP